MHLRVSDEAETVGLDLDQFFDEKIGNWSLFDHTSGIQDGKMISTPVTPPLEEKQDSKV
jgi:hypothetical protein